MAITGIALVVAIVVYYFPKTPLKTQKVLINGKEITVRVADSWAKQQKGLSGQKDLPEDQGLLFIYSQPGQRSVWMKDMNFPIDVIWINRDWQIVEITTNLEPESFPKRFSPSHPAQHFLEVNSNWATENNIKRGDRVKIEY